ncbi:MAG: glycosyltransferase family 2 protein [Roseobacter sp.]
MSTSPSSSPSGPTVLTIVLNYKTAEMTLQSVQAARTAMENISGGIVVVDNDSQDGSYEAILAHVTQEGWDKEDAVRVIQAGRNGGFGAGNNVGIKAGLPDGSIPDYIYVLNSDAFPAPNAIHKLLEHLEANPKSGFAGSYIHGPEGDRQQSAFRFPSIMSEFEGSVRLGLLTTLLKNYRVPMEIPTQTGPVNWVAGASMLMRQSVLNQIGLFDETFFLYFEEVDLCRRAGQAGYSTDYVPASKVTHIGSVSTGMKEWKRVPSYWYDSRWHYFSKNHGAFYAMTATMAHLCGGFLHALRCLILRRDRHVTPGFLKTMVTHDFRALIRRPTSSPLKESQSSI